MFDRLSLIYVEKFVDFFFENVFVFLSNIFDISW